MIAAACLAIGLHLGSVHSAPGFNGTNPGLYCRTPGDWVVGTYYNSIRRQTFYAGKVWEPWSLPGGGRAGFVLGVATGYRGPVTPLPLAVATASWPIADHTSVRLTFAPKFRVNGAAALNLALEYRF